MEVMQREAGGTGIRKKSCRVYFEKWDISQKMGVMQDVDAMQAGSRAHRKLQKQGRK